MRTTGHNIAGVLFPPSQLYSYISCVSRRDSVSLTRCASTITDVCSLPLMMKSSVGPLAIRYCCSSRYDWWTHTMPVRTGKGQPIPYHPSPLLLLPPVLIAQALSWRYPLLGLLRQMRLSILAQTTPPYTVLFNSVCIYMYVHIYTRALVGVNDSTKTAVEATDACTRRTLLGSVLENNR